MLHPSQQAAYKRIGVFSLFLQSKFCLLFLHICLGTWDVVHIWRAEVLSSGVGTKLHTKIVRLGGKRRIL